MLLDYSQFFVGIATAHLGKSGTKADEASKDMIRHVFFSALLKYKKRFHEYGKIIICCDSKPYWRSEFFKYYKGNRKEAREKSKLDWDFIHDLKLEIESDLVSTFPYKVVKVPGAESDDSMYVLARYTQTHELEQEGLFDDVPQKTVIISGDGDLTQATRFQNVIQYSPRQDKFLKLEVPYSEFMIEHIVRGDTGDGCPAILSMDHYLVEKVKQPSITKPYLQKFLEHGESACTTDLERRNWKRNQTLVDLEFIPQEICDNIIHTYETYERKGNLNKVRMYFMKHGLKNLSNDVSLFGEN